MGDVGEWVCARMGNVVKTGGGRIGETRMGELRREALERI